jgi:hypothetical protein
MAIGKQRLEHVISCQFSRQLANQDPLDLRDLQGPQVLQM